MTKQGPLLRMGEISVSNSSRHVLEFGNVKVLDDCIELALSSSKTDQTGGEGKCRAEKFTFAKRVAHTRQTQNNYFQQVLSDRQSGIWFTTH
jgi:hypothetical protein